MKGSLLVSVSLVASLLLLLGSCSSENNAIEEQFDVVVRLRAEPDNLNPTRSASSAATPIESLIMPPLAEYDAQTLELMPILVRSLATVEPITEGPYAGGERYTYEFRDEAVWDDGSPITGRDYEFTIKSVMNPEVNASAWRSFLSFIVEVELYPDNPRKFTAIIKEPYMLAEAITCNFNLLPRHVYDPEDILADFSVAQLTDENIGELNDAQNEQLRRFAESFGDAKFNRDIVQGAGAYTLEQWETGQFVVLKRKAQWWGDEITSDHDAFQANPDRIIYRFIPDEAAALAALKDESVDLVAGVSALGFAQMRDDAQWAEKFSFQTPELLQYRYIEINHRDPVLSDPSVRKALAYAIDYDAIINNIELGMATRTVGPFSPAKDYYHKELELLSQDLDMAREALTNGGWEDTNNDGTVDKVIDGNREELVLEITTTQSPAGQQVALIMKESAAKIGVNIEIETKDVSAWRQSINAREFDLLPMQSRTSPAPNDPYQNWHSDSDVPGGGNRAGYQSDRVDAIIESIRQAETADDRLPLYLELQEVMYEEQPVIFLYVPVERIISSGTLDVQGSSRRPGYFPNTFKPRATG